MIDDDEDDGYGEDSFEESSPKKKIPSTDMAEASDDENLFDDLDEEETDNGLEQEQEQEEENEKRFEEGMNLDDFLKQFNEEETEEEKKTAAEDPSLRPLVGFSPPAQKDARDEYLAKTLNHNGLQDSPIAFGCNGLSISPSSPSKTEQQNGLANLSPEQRLMQAVQVEEENAARVDALLKKLNVKHVLQEVVEEQAAKVAYPVHKDSTSAVANNYKHPKGLVADKKHNPLPLYSKYNGGNEPTKTDKPNETSQLEGSKDVQLLASQIAKLKQEMKRKDDRLGRVVEHDTLVQNKCDSLTREVAYLKQCLHETSMEAQSQMARADNAILNTKKKKKTVKKNSNLEAEVRTLREENDSLKSRESALLEAINEMSQQNEELMRQLKAGMEKETRYAQLIHSMQQGNMDTNSNGPSPNKTGGHHEEKKKRRGRSMTTGAVEGSSSKGKLPNIAQKFHRHNLTKAFHCFD